MGGYHFAFDEVMKKMLLKTAALMLIEDLASVYLGNRRIGGHMLIIG